MITKINDFRNINENNVETKELWYVKDINSSVKNLSTSNVDAQKFLRDSLKNSGTVFYVVVPKADWESEKINASNIAQYAKNLYQNPIKENQEPIKQFTQSTGEGGADWYRWKSDDNQKFWSKLTQHVLGMEDETNPNHYISALSPESQRLLVGIANDMLKTDN